MTERAARLSSNGTERQAELEITRLAEVEHIVQKMARKFSEDNPLVIEDLAQEAREAIIRKLRENPDCPTSHLVTKITGAIINYRRAGTSVDGKLNAHYFRPKPYRIVSIEGPAIGENTAPTRTSLLSDRISDPYQPLRRTEQQALTNVMFAGLKDRLSPRDHLALTLRLQGITWKETGRRLKLSPYYLAKTRKRIKNAIRVEWHPFESKPAEQN